MRDLALHQRLPADRVYWAIIDGRALPRRMRRSPEKLGYLVEGRIPVPLDELHIVFTALRDGRHLACAMERAGLEGIPDAALTLTPEAVPAELGIEVEPTRIDLLVGRYQSRAVGRLLRTEFRWTWAILALIGITLGAGVERRIHDVNERAALHVRDGEDRVQGLFAGSGGSALPPELRLEAEWRALSQTRARGIDPIEMKSVTPVLTSLFAHWPRGAHFMTQSLLLAEDAITLQGVVPDMADAERVVAALREIPGWSSEQPSLRAVAKQVSVGIRWTRRTDVAPKGPP